MFGFLLLFRSSNEPVSPKAALPRGGANEGCGFYIYMCLEASGFTFSHRKGPWIEIQATWVLILVWPLNYCMAIHLCCQGLSFLICKARGG